MMKKIVFLCPYFGKLPGHFQLWLDSCADNPEVCWRIYTDDHTVYPLPENVSIEYTTLAELHDRFQQKFDFPIALSTIKKLGDYKPLFGYLFEEEIRDFAFWGHIDLADEIYGNIRKFVTDDVMAKYDKIMLFGHMSLYRNTPEVNRRFMASTGTELDYKQIFGTEHFYNFEEIAHGSIADIYRHNGWPIGRLDDKYADLRCVSYAFQFGVWTEDLSRYIVLNKRPCIFTREGGALYCYYLRKGAVCKEEMMYAHFKRRKMPGYDTLKTKDYLMLPSGFADFEPVTPALIRRANKGPLFYEAYWSQRKKTVMDKIRRLLGLQKK